MKKYLAYVLTVLALSCTLCGCGNGRTDSDKVFESPIIEMENDIDDGIVNDKDGIIDDDKSGNAGTNNSTMNNGAGTGNSVTSGTGNNGAKTSPSPEVSKNP